MCIECLTERVSHIQNDPGHRLSIVWSHGNTSRRSAVQVAYEWLSRSHTAANAIVGERSTEKLYVDQSIYVSWHHEREFHWLGDFKSFQDTFLYCSSISFGFNSLAQDSSDFGRLSVIQTSFDIMQTIKQTPVACFWFQCAAGAPYLLKRPVLTLKASADPLCALSDILRHHNAIFPLHDLLCSAPNSGYLVAWIIPESSCPAMF